jgi:hypothetical protein
MINSLEDEDEEEDRLNDDDEEELKREDEEQEDIYSDDMSGWRLKCLLKISEATPAVKTPQEM